MENKFQIANNNVDGLRKELKKTKRERDDAMVRLSGHHLDQPANYSMYYSSKYHLLNASFNINSKNAYKITSQF